MLLDRSDRGEGPHVRGYNRGGAPVGGVGVTKPVGVLGGAPKPKAPTAPTAIFSVGTAVVHPTFGKGVVLSVRTLPGDALYEIAFDECGTKKLMAKMAKLKQGE